MTSSASPQLDGRIDWNGTYAALIAQNPAGSIPDGTTAQTTDKGKVVSNKAAGTWDTVSVTHIGGSDPSVAYNVPLTAFALTIAAGILTLILDPAGTLAAGAVTMPAAPYDNQPVTIMSSQIVTALVINANAGQTINGAPTAFAANTAFRFRYKLSNTTWYREL